MRIILLGHRDVASIYALDRLISLLPGHEISVFTSTSEAAPGEGPLAELQAIDQRLLEEYLAAPATAPALRDAASLDSPNSGAGLEMLRAAAPDLIVSIRYRRILRDAAIAIPAHGVLNLHSGLLPDYRGVMATFWALLNEEADIGCTLHRIVDAGIDTGPIIASVRQAARPDETYLWNVLSLYAEGCAITASAVRAIARGEDIGARGQADDAGHYYSAPPADAVRSFLDQGLELADGAELRGLRR